MAVGVPNARADTATGSIVGTSGSPANKLPFTSGDYAVAVICVYGDRSSVSTSYVRAYGTSTYYGLTKKAEAASSTGWVEIWSGIISATDSFYLVAQYSASITALLDFFRVTGHDPTTPLDTYAQYAGTNPVTNDLTAAGGGSLVIVGGYQNADVSITSDSTSGTVTLYSGANIGKPAKVGIADSYGPQTISMAVAGAMASIAIKPPGTLYDADAALSLGVTGTGSITRIKPADATVTIGVTGTATASVIHSADASLTLGVVGTAAGHNSLGHGDASLTLGVVATATAYVIHYADATLTIGITAAAHGGIPRDLHPVVVAGPTGRIVTVCGPTGHTTAIGEPHGRVVIAAGPAGRRITTSDPHGRAITVTGPRS